MSSTEVQKEILLLYKRLPLSAKKELLVTLTDIAVKEGKLADTEEERLRFRVENLSSAIESILGEPFIIKSRKSRLVWARKLMAYQLHEEGFLDRQLQPFLGRDRSTINLMRKDVKTMLQYPNQYHEEMAIWRNLQEIIGNSH